MAKESSANLVQDVSNIKKDVIKLLQPVSSQGIRNDSRTGTRTRNFAGLSRESHKSMTEKTCFVVTPARLDDMSLRVRVRHLEPKEGGKSIFEMGIPVKCSLESAFSSRCFWNFGADFIGREIHPILERNLCDRINAFQNNHRVFAKFKHRINPRRRRHLVSKVGNKPGAVKGVLSEEALELRNSVNKISRRNANCSGIAMVINTNSHIKLMQVLRCIRKIPRMRKINVVRETKLKRQKWQPLTG